MRSIRVQSRQKAFKAADFREAILKSKQSRKHHWVELDSQVRLRQWQFFLLHRTVLGSPAKRSASQEVFDKPMSTATPNPVAPMGKSSQVEIPDRTRSTTNSSDAIMATREPEKYDVLVLGSGTGGKLIAWTMASEGKRTASIERKYVGGACPNIACLPSKNIIHSAKVASLFSRHQEFGIETGPVTVNMAGVYARKKKMVDSLMKAHLDQYHASGAELIWG